MNFEFNIRPTIMIMITCTKKIVVLIRSAIATEAQLKVKRLIEVLSKK